MTLSRRLSRRPSGQASFRFSPFVGITCRMPGVGPAPHEAQSRPCFIDCTHFRVNESGLESGGLHEIECTVRLHPRRLFRPADPEPRTRNQSRFELCDTIARRGSPRHENHCNVKVRIRSNPASPGRKRLEQDLESSRRAEQQQTALVTDSELPGQWCRGVPGHAFDRGASSDRLLG